MYYSRGPDVGFQLARIRHGYQVAEFGRAVKVFHLVQDNTRFFYDMLPDNPVYRTLPATPYSDDPASHAHGLGDTEALVRQLCVEIRVRG